MNNVQKRLLEPLAQLWARLEPDLPALILVSIFGAFGAGIAIRWRIKIGASPLLDAINDGDILLQIALGIAGALAAVFLLARTDTTKLIHCAMIALFSGIAGPYLVVRALQVVITDLKPGDVNAKTTAANVIAVQAADVAKEVKAISDKKPENPNILVKAVGKATEATKSFLSVIQSLPPDEKERSLDKNKEHLKNTLDAIASAAPQVTEAFPQIKEVADEARNANAPDIAAKADQILSNNATQSSKPAAQAAAQNALKFPFYFITPPTVTDDSLVVLQHDVLQAFPELQFQGSVHPSKRMDGGIEVVYYKPSDDQRADKLLRFVDEYFRKKGISVTTSKNQQPGESGAASQFDIHLGPGVAETLSKQRALPTPDSSASPAPSPNSNPPRKRNRRPRRAELNQSRLLFRSAV
jgi:uncharacterized membrane protein YeaQ/YmgE (transglycosylase-associated protein family)